MSYFDGPELLSHGSSSGRKVLAQLRDGRSQHLFDLLGKNKLHFFGHGLGQLGEILFIFQRQNHSLDPHAARGQDFLFDACLSFIECCGRVGALNDPCVYRLERLTNRNDGTTHR